MIERTTKAPAAAARFWDERYGDYITVYGDEPNAFFKENLTKLPAGSVLLPGEGEGRNAVFAARQGWKVDAFDFSPAARAKAIARASDSKVAVHYTTADIGDIILPVNTYDAVALVYVHLDPGMRRAFHRQVAGSLKTGGHIILEAFARDQINNISGGPRNEKLLYSLSDIEGDLTGMHFITSRQERIKLNEGPFHQGTADVVRILAVKR